MGEKHQVEIAPDGVTTHAEAGADLRESLTGQSIYLTGPCGGKGTCKKCRVLVQEPDGEAQEVLACQYRVHSDVRVTVPGASRIEVSADEVDANEATKTALSVELAPSVDAGGLAKGKKTRRILGLAVDLGTTAVSASLIDLQTGRPLGFATVMNQQGQFGADVMTRIDYSLKGEGHRKELSASLAESVQLLAGALLSRAASSLSDVHHVVFAGNTTMFATLLELDCRSLVTPPYSAPLVESLTLRPPNAGAFRELGLASRTRLDFLPGIGGFVGSDALSGLLIARMRVPDAPFVFLDIGTNSETIVASRAGFVASSAAAGPAFEGGEISCGMAAMRGAIRKVGLENGQLRYEVIGNAKPMGICGSGLIDACASLVRSGAIEPSGRFCDDAGSLPTRLAERIARKDGQPAFFFDKSVWITQEDVRKAQLAKGAIRTCIEFLLSEAQVEPGAVGRLMLGGAFGSLVNPQSAETIGLIPVFENAAKESLGNTSLAGATAALVSRRKLDEILRLREKTRYLNLAGRPEFQERFAANLALEASP